MKQVRLILMFLVLVVCNSISQGQTKHTTTDSSKFKWVDFDQFRASYNPGNYKLHVLTQIFRDRPYNPRNYPNLSDSLYNVYQYYLVDEFFLVDSLRLHHTKTKETDRVFHMLDLRKVVFLDTVILVPATGSEEFNRRAPAIPRLDALVGKTLLASITVIKKKYVPEVSGNVIDPFVVEIYAELNKFSIKRKR